MKFRLPEIPYATTGLPPFLTAETMEFHYGKHHKTYIDKMNEMLPGTEFDSMNLEDIVKKSSGPLFNNAAQAWNHTFYWLGLEKTATEPTSGPLFDAIKKDFGSMEDFKKKFSEKTIGVFGSGWGWLVQKADGKLDIVGTSNAANPMTNGDKPLLTCDVWEHAYYIDYRNARPKYLESFWKSVNWKFVEKNLATSGAPDMTVHMKA